MDDPEGAKESSAEGSGTEQSGDTGEIDADEEDGEEKEEEEAKEGSAEASESSSVRQQGVGEEEEKEMAPAEESSTAVIAVATTVAEGSPWDYFSWCWSLKLGQAGFTAAVNQLFSSHAVTKLVSETLLEWSQGQAALAQRLQSASVQYSNSLHQTVIPSISWPQTEGKSRDSAFSTSCLDDRDSCRVVSECFASEAAAIGDFGRLLDHLGAAIRIVK